MQNLFHIFFRGGLFLGTRKGICYGLNCMPQNSYDEALMPNTSECGLFGCSTLKGLNSRAFNKLNKLKQGCHGGPNSNPTGILIRRGNLDTKCMQRKVCVRI